jgi:hypothetical protein
MSPVLANGLALLLLVAVLGGLAAHWWLRRRLADLLAQQLRMQSDWLAWSQALDSRLALRPEIDLQPLQQRLDDLAVAVRAIRQAEAPKLDLSLVQGRLATLEQAVRALVVPAAQPLDLTPLRQRLDALDAAVRAANRLPTAAGEHSPAQAASSNHP